MRKASGLDAGCARSRHAAAANDTFLIRNADVYPVTSARMKGVLGADRRTARSPISERRSSRRRECKILEGKGLRVYPGMIDSNTELGLSEIQRRSRDGRHRRDSASSCRRFRALIAVNPESEHIPVVRVNGITSVMTFPAPGGAEAAGRAGPQRQMISGQAALIHLDGWTWEDMEINRSRGDGTPCSRHPGGGRWTRRISASFRRRRRSDLHGTEARVRSGQSQKLNEFFDAGARNIRKSESGRPRGLRDGSEVGSDDSGSRREDARGGFRDARARNQGRDCLRRESNTSRS